MVKKILFWAGVAFVAFVLITRPALAADVVNGLFSSADSLATFVERLG